MAIPPNLDPQYLRGIVDMGSNGIRFSISSLQPPTARIMPTLYQHRVGISLYDAQYSASGERQPIDDETVAAVIKAFKQFQRTCADFGVPEEHITVLATEATRTAINSEDFRARIKEAVGWEVTLMPKEEEGRVGAMGIASSLPEVSGLVMDLGGGSTQLSWLSYDGKGEVKMPERGAVSMPYGAAAMSRRLAEAERGGSTEDLSAEIKAAMKQAYQDLEVPPDLTKAAVANGGFTLYLSGGGFRGWGYMLMSRHRVCPYPIPVINGFKASRHEFSGTEDIKSAAAASLRNENDEIFRVSDRRASQVPAVAFLINALAEVIPQIREVRFCQGGVREGYLFSSLRPDVKGQYPLVVATRPFSRHLSNPVVELLALALPSEAFTSITKNFFNALKTGLLEAFANMMYYHSSHSKDLQASAALRCTTSGPLASVHGILHESRTLLALLLCERWGGEVPPVDGAFKQSLEQLVESSLTLWWINYIGAVAALVAAVYPSGIPDGLSERRLELSTTPGAKEEGREQISLRIGFATKDDVDVFAKEIKSIEKVGKRKNWIGGKDGVGVGIDVEVEVGIVQT